MKRNILRAVFAYAVILTLASLALFASIDWDPPYVMSGWQCDPMLCDEGLYGIYTGSVHVNGYGDCYNGYPLFVDPGVQAVGCAFPVTLNAHISYDRQYQQIGGQLYDVEGLVGTAKAWDHNGILYWTSWWKDYCSSLGGGQRIQGPTPC